MTETIIIVSAVVLLGVLCFSMIGCNTDRAEDDYLQEQYLKEWSDKHK